MSSASRKRRKQEIKKQGDETTVSYNTNPLSNNNALAYANASSLALKVLNENSKMTIEPTRTLKTGQYDSSATATMNGPLASASSNTPAKYLEDDDAIYDSDEEVSTSASNAAKHPPSKIPRLCPPVQASSTQNRVDEPNKPTIKLEQRDPSNVNSVEMKEASDDDEACLDDEDVQRLSKEFRYISSNGLSWAAKKCKPASAFNKAYRTNWKARSYHYTRYSDIKVKGNRSSTGLSI